MKEQNGDKIRAFLKSDLKFTKSQVNEFMEMVEKTGAILFEQLKYSDNTVTAKTLFTIDSRKPIRYFAGAFSMDLSSEFFIDGLSEMDKTDYQMLLDAKNEMKRKAKLNIN